MALNVTPVNRNLQTRVTFMCLEFEDLFVVLGVAALTNVARHASAKRVDIGLTLEGPSAILTVTDDGRGIAPEVLLRQTSLGLMGMRERALAFGGTLELSAEAGRGTTVAVRVPVGSPETG